MNGQNPDIERFNRWSASYDQSVFQRLFFGPVQRTVLSMADLQSEPATIIDVGCGTGRLLRSAKERWPTARLIGVDPSEGMIEIARQLNPHTEFYIAPAEAIPLADVSVDLAFSTISFHHWSNQLGGIREIARILRPGADALFLLIKLLIKTRQFGFAYCSVSSIAFIARHPGYLKYRKCLKYPAFRL